MPPKKATAAKAGTKAKPAKKKAEKEEVVVETKEVPEKKPRKAAKKAEEPKEEKVEVDQEEEAPQKKSRATKAAGTSKKGKTEKAEDDEPNEKENGTVKKRGAKPKKTKEETPEPVSTTVEKKKAAPPRGRRAKKTEEPEEEVEAQADVEPAEEEASDSKKGRKRKAAPKEKKEPKSDEPVAKTTKANATTTNWEAIDFKCSAKNSKGETPNFHITSWNVDGLRAWLKKGGLDILQYDQPDILCLQETKCSVEKLPEEITDVDGYELLWCCSDKEGYAGVGIATKVKPLSVTYGIESEEHDAEGRCITAEFEKFFLVNVYVPNAGRKLVTLPKRLEWNKLFKEHIQKLDERKPVIVCGDMNVAHTEIDLANPKTNTKNAGFTVEEREGMTDFLEDGYVDTFRRLYPDKEKAYTFWTYMANARTKNTGWRLDYFIVSDRLMENVCDNIIHNEVLGSDHCPIALHLNI